MKNKIIFILLLALVLFIPSAQAGIFSDSVDWFKKIFGFTITISDTNYVEYKGYEYFSDKDLYLCGVMNGKLNACQQPIFVLTNNNDFTDFISVEPDFSEDVIIEKIEKINSIEKIIKANGTGEEIITYEQEYEEININDASTSKRSRKKTNEIKIESGESLAFRVTFKPTEIYSGEFYGCFNSQKYGRICFDPIYNQTDGFYVGDRISAGYFGGVATDGSNILAFDIEKRAYAYDMSGVYVTTYQTSAVGTSPDGILFNGTDIWVIATNPGVIHRFDLSDNQRQAIGLSDLNNCDNGMSGGIAYNGSSFFLKCYNTPNYLWNEYNTYWNFIRQTNIPGGHNDMYVDDNNEFFFINTTNFLINYDAQGNRLEVSEDLKPFGISLVTKTMGGTGGKNYTDNLNLWIGDNNDRFVYHLLYETGDVPPPPPPPTDRTSTNITLIYNYTLKPNPLYLNNTGMNLSFRLFDGYSYFVGGGDVLNMPFEIKDYNYEIADFSGWKNNGTIIFGASGATWCEDCGYDNSGAYEFDGINDFINVSIDNTINLTNQLSFSVWINPKKLDYTNGHLLFIKASDGNWVDGFGAFYEMDYMFFYVGEYGKFARKSFSSINTWSHIAGTYDGSTIRIYVNGVEGTSYPLSNGLTGTSKNLYIGNEPNTFPTGYYKYNGTLDELNIWNRSLSSSEIQALYNDDAYDYSYLTYNASVKKNDVFEFENIITPTKLYNSFFIHPSNFSKNSVGENWSIELSSNDASIFMSNNISSLIIINEEIYDSIAYEGQITTFSVNLTLLEGNIIEGNLTYNNSLYLGNINNDVISKTINVPILGEDGDVPFFWDINTYYEIKNTTLKYQSIQAIKIDDCTTYSNLFINYSLKDEGSQKLVDNSTLATKIETDILLYSPLNSSINWKYNNTRINQTNILVCIKANITNSSGYYILDSTTKYSANTYVTEYWYFDNWILNNNTMSQHINLFILLASESTSFLITYFDEYYMGLKGVIIEVWMYYVGEAIYKPVEHALTNDDGQTRVHLVSEDVQYYLIARKDGKILYTTEPSFALCLSAPCQINIYSAGDVGDFGNLEKEENIVYSFTTNDETGYIYYSFATDDGSQSTFNLTVKRLDAYDNYTVSSQQITSSSGILTYTLASSLYNYTYIAEAWKDGKIIKYGFISVRESPSSLFGGTGMILATIMIITIPLMGISSGGVAVILLTLIGLIGASYFYIIKLSWVTLIWIMCVGAIIIWKIWRRSSTP